MAGEVDMEV